MRTEEVDLCRDCPFYYRPDDRGPPNCLQENGPSWITVTPDGTPPADCPLPVLVRIKERVSQNCDTEDDGG